MGRVQPILRKLNLWVEQAGRGIILGGLCIILRQTVVVVVVVFGQKLGWRRFNDRAGCKDRAYARQRDRRRFRGAQRYVLLGSDELWWLLVRTHLPGHNSMGKKKEVLLVKEEKRHHATAAVL